MSASWPARPRIAVAIRIVALGGPVAVSVAVTSAAGRAVPPPAGSILLQVVWWLALSGVATVSLLAAGRLARRLLPLAALMRLSLVFPDAAPSRFRVALRTGTTSTLEERLEAARAGAPGRTPVESAELLLELVAHLDEHDPLTRGHSERVRAYAQSIGRELGLDPRELDLLNWAALLHDVGKLDVPTEILAKDGRPTEAEWEVLRGHPAAGGRLASPLRPWLGEWSAAIEQHHERWDGGGYPHGLAGTEISLAGRITAVADVFDVITSSRTYKQPASVAEARHELSRCAGTQFDPAVVRAFLSISVRQSRLAAPLGWLANAAALARLPATPAAAGLSAGVAAVALGAGIGTSATQHLPATAFARAPVVHTAGTRAAARVPSSKETPPTAAATTRARARPSPQHRSAHAQVPPRHVPGSPAPAPAAIPVAAPAAAPSAPVSRARQSEAESSSAPVGPATAPKAEGGVVKVQARAAEHAVTPPAPPARKAPAHEVVSSVTDAVAGVVNGVAKLPLVAALPVVPQVTQDVATLTGDVSSLTDPSTPPADDVATLADDVTSLAKDVTSLVTPPSPPAPPPPQQAPPAPPVETVISTLHGLLSKHPG